MMTIDGNGEERPQCVLCLTVMAGESMKPSKLKGTSRLNIEITSTTQWKCSELGRNATD